MKYLLGCSNTSRNEECPHTLHLDDEEVFTNLQIIEGGESKEEGTKMVTGHYKITDEELSEESGCDFAFIVCASLKEVECHIHRISGHSSSEVLKEYSKKFKLWNDVEY